MPSRFDHNAEPPPTPAELEERRQQARQLGTREKLGPSAPHIEVVKHTCGVCNCWAPTQEGAGQHHPQCRVFDACRACAVEGLEEEVLCPSCDKQGIRTVEECPSCNPYR